jgi:hypothetical protein
MGVMKFLLPPGLPGEILRELYRASLSVAGDTAPGPTQVTVQAEELLISRPINESGCLLVPWDVNGIGRVMVRSATVMERAAPYQLVLELARGKINQLRGEGSDWLALGLTLPANLSTEIRQVTLQFARAVCQPPGPDLHDLAQATLLAGHHAADDLVHTYMNQVLQYRHQRQARLDATLGCQLGSMGPGDNITEALASAVHQVSLPFRWNDVEPTEGDFCWEPHDALVEWAGKHDLKTVGGPLIDFSGLCLPSWLWRRERDLGSLCGYLCDFVGRTIRRYRGRIRTWQVTAASNSSQVLGATDEELLWLTMRLVEAARSVDPGLDLTVGIAQPWGEYMAASEMTQSPFVFADTLVRTGLRLNALDLEIVMGIHPRGSYCRDLLETSRLLDLFARLGLPLQLTLGYPSSNGTDPQADSDLSVDAGHWQGGFSEQVQADWGTAVVKLALCKQGVRAVQWIHTLDGEPHLFPHCGLVDAQGNIKPILERLRAVRREHLC